MARDEWNERAVRVGVAAVARGVERTGRRRLEFRDRRDARIRGGAANRRSARIEPREVFGAEVTIRAAHFTLLLVLDGERAATDVAPLAAEQDVPAGALVVALTP